MKMKTMREAFEASKATGEHEPFDTAGTGWARGATVKALPGGAELVREGDLEYALREATGAWECVTPVDGVAK
jgi:hypothetical protein